MKKIIQSKMAQNHQVFILKSNYYVRHFSKSKG